MNKIKHIQQTSSKTTILVEDTYGDNHSICLLGRMKIVNANLDHLVQKAINGSRGYLGVKIYKRRGVDVVS